MANTSKLVVFQDENVKIDGQYSLSFNCYGLGDVVFEVKGTDTCDIEVQVAVKTIGSDKKELSDDNIAWTQLAVISASDFSVGSKIEAKGIYYASLAGCSKVRLNRSEERR